MTTKVRSSTIQSVANTQITGLITSSQIATVANTQITGTVAAANTISTQHFTVQEASNKLIIQYNGVTVFSIDSTGNVVSANNVTAGGTP